MAGAGGAPCTVVAPEAPVACVAPEAPPARRRDPHNGSVKSTRGALRAGTAVLALVLVAGCGGSGDSSRGAASPLPSASASAGKASPGTTPRGKTTKPGAPAAKPSTKPSTGTATGSGGGSGGGSTGGTTGGSGSQTRSAPAPTKPGSYTYDVKGKASASNGQSEDINGTATLKVAAPAGSTQRSTLSSEQNSTEQDLVFTSGGILLARLKVNSQMGAIEFRPAKPVLAMPSPPTTGRTWSWSMTSTDGKTKADYSGRITGTERVTIGGVAVDTVVVESTLKLSGDGYTLTQESRANHDPSRSLRVKEKSRSVATFGVYGGTADTTNQLRSLTPR